MKMMINNYIVEKKIEKKKNFKKEKQKTKTKQNKNHTTKPNQKGKTHNQTKSKEKNRITKFNLKSLNTKNDDDICRCKSRSWLWTDTSMLM